MRYNPYYYTWRGDDIENAALSKLLGSEYNFQIHYSGYRAAVNYFKNAIKQKRYSQCVGDERLDYIKAYIVCVKRLRILKRLINLKYFK